MAVSKEVKDLLKLGRNKKSKEVEPKPVVNVKKTKVKAKPMVKETKAEEIKAKSTEDVNPVVEASPVVEVKTPIVPNNIEEIPEGTNPAEPINTMAVQLRTVIPNFYRAPNIRR